MSTVLEAVSGGSLEQARALIERAERVDGTPPISDQAQLAVSQGQRELVLFFDTGRRSSQSRPGAAVRLDELDELDEQNAEPVAVGIVGQGEIDLVVDPPARGRSVGTAALTALLDRPHGELLAWAHGANPAADALLAHAGFEPVRSLYRMALDPALLPPAGTDPLAVALPEGFALRAFDPANPADAPAWVRINAIAFADHPEQGRITESDFALQREEPWFDAGDLLLLAAPPADDAEGELAGSTWIKTVRTPEGTETELYAVGVDPAHAGRGLGRALLDATLARMAEHRPDRVTLYVDGENERAVRMYEAAGFTVDSRSRQWRRAG